MHPHPPSLQNPAPVLHKIKTLITFATHQTIASAYHLCVAYKMLTYPDTFKICYDLLLPLCEKKQILFSLVVVDFSTLCCMLRASTFGGVLHSLIRS